MIKCNQSHFRKRDYVVQIQFLFLETNFLSEKLFALGHLLKCQMTVRSSLSEVF